MCLAEDEGKVEHGVDLWGDAGVKRHRRALLIVDDGCGSGAALAEAMKRLAIQDPVTRFGDFGQALAHLQRANELPCLIALCVNTAEKNAIGFIQSLKKDTNLMLIPLVVLAAAHDSEAVDKSFAMGVTGYYVIGDGDNEGLLWAIATIMEYWGLSEMPA